MDKLDDLKASFAKQGHNSPHDHSPLLSPSGPRSRQEFPSAKIFSSYSRLPRRVVRPSQRCGFDWLRPA